MCALTELCYYLTVKLLEVVCAQFVWHGGLVMNCEAVRSSMCTVCVAWWTGDEMFMALDQRSVCCRLTDSHIVVMLRL